ncbi:MAG: hypothetical protein FWD73_10895 [Polyangiaceae bacterium]|nr:hypothetical protein [Polyangiaceae bacterium]
MPIEHPEQVEHTEHVMWGKGGVASFVAVTDDAVTLRSSVSSPPGSRLDGALVNHPAAEIRIKVHSSKREEDGSFTIRGRLIDATRELRERIASLVAEDSRR